MSFPEPQDFTVVVAAEDDDGNAVFIDTPVKPAVLHVPGAVEAAWYWAVDGGHQIQNFGGPAESVRTATVDGSTFGIVRFPARSAGKLDVGATGTEGAESGHGNDPGMHATDTIDYELILSGQIDLVLPGGATRTLKAGDMVVKSGAAHAWKNPYDEDCMYVSVTIGATRAT
jgi:hypothetical protein